MKRLTCANSYTRGTHMVDEKYMWRRTLISVVYIEFNSVGGLEQLNVLKLN